MFHKRVVVCMMFFVGLTEAMGTETPKWVNQVPRSADMYYFVGAGSGKLQPEAMQNARKDALGQILLNIHASISSKSSFSSTYEENQHEDHFLQKGYQKIDVKGQSAIKNFQIVKSFCNKEGEKFVCHSLAQIPKSTITQAKDDVEKIREQLSQSSLCILAVTQDPEATVLSRNESFQAYLEQLYQSQGYSIQNIPLSLDTLQQGNSAQNITQLRQQIGAQAKVLLYAALSVDETRTETLINTNTTIAQGRLTLYEVDISSGNTLSVQVFEDRGVSYTTQSQAFRQLQKKLLAQFTGNDKENTGDYLDY